MAAHNTAVQLVMNSATLLLPGITESRALWPNRLRRLIARADAETSTTWGYEEALSVALGYPAHARGSPVARCCYLSDFNESAPLDCARADPVNLRMDRDDAHLIPGDILQLRDAEADSLISTLNKHFADDGLQFVVGRKQRWYVCGFVATELDAAPLNRVAGRPVAHYLPVADESRPWRKLASEVQMLLHDHPVNQERTNRGLLPVNALWFWGAATLPPREPSPSTRLYSDAAYARGLARLSGVTAFPYNEAAASLANPVAANPQAARRDHLIVVDKELIESLLRQDNDAQLQAMTRIDTHLLAVAEQALWRGRLKELVIDTCEHQRYCLTRARLLRWWRRAPRDTPASDPVERNTTLESATPDA